MVRVATILPFFGNTGVPSFLLFGYSESSRSWAWSVLCSRPWKRKTEDFSFSFVTATVWALASSQGSRLSVSNFDQRDVVMQWVSFLHCWRRWLMSFTLNSSCERFFCSRLSKFRRNRWRIPLPLLSLSSSPFPPIPLYLPQSLSLFLSQESLRMTVCFISMLWHSNRSR